MVAEAGSEGAAVTTSTSAASATSLSSITPPSFLERGVDRVPFLEKELFLLRRLVRSGDVCVDVGAAGGAHLFVMARRAGPHGHVIGVEPRPGSYQALRWMVRAAGLRRRVSLVAVALADRSGRQRLRIPIVPTRAHFRGSLDDPDGAAAFASLPHRDIWVVTDTLDDVVERAAVGTVDVVKCDVEGAELLVLAGADRVLSEHRPIILVEADDQHQRRFDARAQDVLDLADAYAYQPHRYVRGALQSLTGIVAGEDDYVLIPRERVDRVAQRVQIVGRDADPAGRRRVDLAA